MSSELPKKTRSHVLETISDRTFVSLIPPEWQRLDAERDYGLDLRVEIFTRTTPSETTGLEFGVQLKATDNEDGKNDKVGIARSTVSYWNSLRIPVLVVRYRSATGETYGRWAHNRPLGPESGTETKYAWFRFTSDDLLSPDAACWDQIESDVRADRAVRDRQIRFPLELALRGPNADAEAEVQLNAELAERLGPGKVRVAVDRVGPPAVVLGETHIGVDLGGSTGVYFHDVPPEASQSTSSILLALGLALGRFETGRMTVECLEASTDSPLSRDPQALLTASFMLAEAQRPDLGLARLLDLGDFSDPDCVSAGALLVLQADPSTIPFELVTALRDAALGAASTQEERTAALFNMANAFERMCDLEEARTLLARFIDESDSSYPSRPTVAERIAGLNFLLRDYAAAADSYRQLATEGPISSYTRAAWAESALYAGRFAEAEAILDDSDNQDDPSEWFMRVIVGAVRAWAPTDLQVRDSAAAANLHEQLAQSGRLPDRDGSAVVELAALDVLFTPLWVEIVQLSFATGITNVVPMAALTAAHLARTDTFLWAHALVFLSGQVDDDKWLEVLRVARAEAGNGVDSEILGLVRTIQSGDPDELPPDAVEQIRRLINLPPAQRKIAMLHGGAPLEPGSDPAT